MLTLKHYYFGRKIILFKNYSIKCRTIVSGENRDTENESRLQNTGIYRFVCKKFVCRPYQVYKLPVIVYNDLNVESPETTIAFQRYSANSRILIRHIIGVA